MKILIIELSNLGDAILTLPALEGLRRAFPNAELHILCSPRVEDLFFGDPRIRRVWIWRKRAPLLRQGFLLGRLFSQRFDRVVDFRHSLIPLFLWGARRTPLIRRGNGPIHRAEQHLALLSGWGIRANGSIRSNGAAAIGFGPEDQRWIEQRIEPNRRVFVVAPGSRSHLKRWGAERFAQVADRLIEEQQGQVFLVGDQEDRSVAQQVIALMRRSATDLTGQTAIRQLAALLTKADLVITNDSALLHAAQAMERPTVAIFGPTDERKYGPRLPNSVVVRRRLICAPCERALCPYGHECMRFLEPDEVYAAAARILSQAVRPQPFDPVRPELVEGRTSLENLR